MTGVQTCALPISIGVDIATSPSPEKLLSTRREILSTGIMEQFYDCLLLENRILTKFEKETLQSVNITFSIVDDADTMIGPTGSHFFRPMYIQLTHYYYLDAILAMVASYIPGPGVKSLHDYPVRRVAS